ncbi:MAG TPA: hypothetical protein VGF92_20265 [Stellaceae bacterium]|jgi:hypothetical protein
MPSILARLKAANCRVDGLLLAPDGTPSFAATPASGEWRAAEQAAVCAALGRAPAAVAPAQRGAAGAAAIERWLDQTAQALGYNNFVTAVSYADSSVDLWRRQALALASWRDAVWQAAIALQTEPVRLPASEAALIALLPQPDIPTS